MKTQQDALLRMDPEPADDIGEPAHPLGELGIGVPASVVDEGRFCTTSGRQVSLDQIGSRVVYRHAMHPRPSSLNVVAAAGRIIFAGCSRRRSIS